MAIYDHGLVQIANGNIEHALSLVDDFLEQAIKDNKNLKAEQLYSLGITYIEAMEYFKAINVLTQSIEKNPAYLDAYFQRAIAWEI